MFKDLLMELVHIVLLVSILIKLDFPTLLRPMKAYSGLVSAGHIDTMGEEITKSALFTSIGPSRVCMCVYLILSSERTTFSSCTMPLRAMTNAKMATAGRA